MTEALSRAELERWVLDFTDAFNREDLDAVMAYFADDSFYDEFHGTRHHGKEAIRAAFAPQFEGAFGKVRFEEEDYFLDVEAGKAMISWTCTLETKQGPGGWRGPWRQSKVRAAGAGSISCGLSTVSLWKSTPTRRQRRPCFSPNRRFRRKGTLRVASDAAKQKS